MVFDWLEGGFGGWLQPSVKPLEFAAENFGEGLNQARLALCQAGLGHMPR